MSKNLDVNVNYTYTKNNDEAIRIPKYKTNLSLAYRMTKKTNFSVDYQFVGDRDDTDFRDFLHVKNVTLESYALLDFGATHKLSKVTLYTNITNILNENYQRFLDFLREEKFQQDSNTNCNHPRKYGANLGVPLWVALSAISFLLSGQKDTLLSLTRHTMHLYHETTTRGISMKMKLSC